MLRIAECEIPVPRPGEVRLAVRATGVNPIDWKLRSGAMADVVPVELPMVPGQDIAGEVEQLGANVRGLAVGDEVFGKVPSGGYAERALAGANRLARKPPALPWELAAALPVAATAAVRALETLGGLAGRTIVINGAAGGVGSLAVQLAVRSGATVIGTASERNHHYLTQLGATPIAYGHGLRDRIRALGATRVDAALDCAGFDSLEPLIEITGDRQRVVTIADPSAASVGVRFVSGDPDDVPAVLTQIAQLAADGLILIPIADVYPLSDAARAQRESERGHVRGKLILVPT